MTKIKLQAIVLAAGKSTRFNTSKTKLSFTLCGQEMLVYPVQLLLKLNIQPTLVLGYQKEAILEIMQKHNLITSYVIQEEQKGTGHAVLASKSSWDSDHILILNGDMPLVTEDIINALINTHIETDATISFVVAHNPDPNLSGYGRIVKDQNKISIVESRHFTQDPAQYCCVNAGIYLVKRQFLEFGLTKLETNSISKELYITDLIKLASDNNEKVETITVPFDNVRGVNTLRELWAAEQIKRAEIIHNWMQKGVHFLAPQTVHIDSQVNIGTDCSIGMGVQLRSNTQILPNCTIDAFSIITNSIIHESVTVQPYSIISDSEIHQQASIGPFAHIKNKSIISSGAQIGNFTEITKSFIGHKSKAKHFSYLGNAKIGSMVNIGAGTVTCNYDGVNKHTTTIENNVFVGSNTALIAPVTISKEAFIAAGSVITKDVPEQALAIARAQQVNKEEYAPKLKEKLKLQENITGILASNPTQITPDRS